MELKVFCFEPLGNEEPPRVEAHRDGAGGWACRCFMCSFEMLIDEVKGIGKCWRCNKERNLRQPISEPIRNDTPIKVKTHKKMNHEEGGGLKPKSQRQPVKKEDRPEGEERLPKSKVKPPEINEPVRVKVSKAPVKKAGSAPGTDKAPASNERESLTEAEGELFSDGWIKLFRKIERSEVFQNEGLLKVWIWCLIRANHQNHWIPMKRGKGTTQVFVRRGQFIFGRESASKALKMPESTVQDRIVKLQSNRYIDIKSDTYYSTITVCNYEKYQSNEGVQVTGKEGEKVTDKENPKATGKQQVSNTYKNDKNKKIYVEDSIELQLSSFLLEEILKNKPDFKRPNLQAWAREVDLMLRRDKRSAEAIERVIGWAQSDHGDGMGKWKGWAAVILSAGKLRDKFDELELKMNETPPTEKKKSW